MTLEQRLAKGEIKVVERGRQRIQDKNSRFWYDGEYRILSDGRRQWRQLRSDGTSSPAWKWEDCK